jgi:dienelactone hydrolase
MKRILRAGLAVLVLVVVVVFALGRPHAPTHPALADADLAPLVPVAEFYMDRSAIWDFAASADGAFIAHRATRFITEGVRIARLADDATLAFIPDAAFHFWDPHGAELNIYTEGRLWRIDPLRPDRDAWLDVTPRGFQGWNILRLPATPEGRQVIASSDRNPAFVDLYTTDRDGGDRQMLVRNEGQTLGWLLDDALVPVARLDRPDPLTTRLMVAEAGGWRAVFDVDLMVDFDLIATDGNGGAFAYSARGRDKTALVRIDLSTGVETVLAEDPVVDVAGAFSLSQVDGPPDVAFFDRAPTRVEPLTERGARFRELLDGLGTGIQVDHVAPAGDGRFVLAVLSPVAISYEYHLFDLEAGSVRRIAAFPFGIRHRANLVATEEVTITARDGLALPSLLLRPAGVGAPGPLVIEVHGGPEAHEIWAYAHFRQFLVNRGYAVLVVNFRGSSGFGKAFRDAGLGGAFGRAMQDDLVDAARWAVAQGIADPGAVAVMGTSYGGYAAAMAALRDPETFAAAVVEFPMLDVAYQSNFPPAFWGLDMARWTRYFGDPTDPDALGQMRALSPTTGAADLARPMLILAGKRDPITGFEQVEDFARAAAAAPMPPEVHIFDEEGHGVGSWQGNVVRARKIEEFLHRRLGGRAEGASVADLAAEWID